MCVICCFNQAHEARCVLRMFLMYVILSANDRKYHLNILTDNYSWAIKTSVVQFEWPGSINFWDKTSAYSCLIICYHQRLCILWLPDSLLSVMSITSVHCITDETEHLQRCSLLAWTKLIYTTCGTTGQGKCSYDIELIFPKYIELCTIRDLISRACSRRHLKYKWVTKLLNHTLVMANCTSHTCALLNVLAL